MGQAESHVEESNSNNFSQRISKDFTFVREKNDPRFGDIQIYKEKNHNKYVFLKGHWCNDEENYNQFLRQCAKRIKINHPNVLKMIGYNQHSETQICGDYSKINCYYEYYSLNLEKELDKRLTESKYFSEPEIWYLLDSIVNACTFFESNKIYHGDIRPVNILLTVQGQVKVADNGIVNQSKNGYIKALFDGEQTYLSPLLMNALQNKEKRPSHNQFKSDIFSLGMTMLECCMLFKSLNFYDFSDLKIQFQVIEEFLQKAKLMYSGFLVNLIREMLNKEEFQRPTFSEISAILAPYKAQIQSLTPFTADYVTVKQNFVHPDQQLFLQSGVTTAPTLFQQVSPHPNFQGLNLLNQSVSVVQSSVGNQSVVKYSPDNSYLAHSNVVFQQSTTPTSFAQSLVSPQTNLPYQMVATPQVFSPNQSIINYQMYGGNNQMNGNIQQQALLQQQQQALLQQQQQNPTQQQQQFQQAVAPQQAQFGFQNQNPLIQNQNGNIINSFAPANQPQVPQQQQSGQSQQLLDKLFGQPLPNNQITGQPQAQQISGQPQQQGQIIYTQQANQISQQNLQDVQFINQFVNQQSQRQFVNQDNIPHNQQQQDTIYTPSNQNNTQQSYSPINMIYQNPQQNQIQPFSDAPQSSFNQPSQQNFSQEQTFYVQHNQQSQRGPMSSDNLPNNISVSSAQFNQFQNQQPQQFQQQTFYQQQNGQSVQDSIQQAINYSNQVLHKNQNN